MTLIKSISGIRGTIGGKTGDNLTPQDIVSSAAGYGSWVLSRNQKPTIVIGRDARISGQIVSELVINTLLSLGINVIDLGLSTTPTVEIAVVKENAHGGIILTASHNPKEWNALKLLNEKGEFISAQNGSEILEIIEKSDIKYASVSNLGTRTKNNDYIQIHIDDICALPLVNIDAITQKKYTIVVDGINSTGAIAVPMLLEKLGCKVITINSEINGNFAHNPEPLPNHLFQLAQDVKFHRAHLGIAVDPDVDRLALVCEDGEMFGEEYTLVAVADYILKHQKGNTVSNLSSTKALKDITLKHGGQYNAAAVGEVNVVEKMKETNAVIGGEGNGGIIYPELHYGRDALVGIALFLSHLALSDKNISILRRTYPNYIISKNKVELSEGIDLDKILDILEEKYKAFKINRVDGLKIEFDEDWIHLRKSNTEPIIRIYAESSSEVIANNLAQKIMKDIHEATLKKEDS